jgi:hypothetical protein
MFALSFLVCFWPVSFFVLSVTLAQLFELLLPVQDDGFENTSYFRFYHTYAWHWLACGVWLIIYLSLMYGTDLSSLGGGCTRGQTTPGCNAAFYWDQKILGLSHMYTQPTYQRLPDCSACSPKDCPGYPGTFPSAPNAPAWCTRAFDPEGIVPSLATIVSVWIGAFCGHIVLATKNSPLERTKQLLPLGCFLITIGMLSGCQPVHAYASTCDSHYR